MTRAQVVQEARAWIGTPFRPQQHIKGHGCDCLGLLIGVAKNLGQVTPDFKAGPYKQAPDNGKLIAGMSTHLKRVPKGYMQAGDFIALAHDGIPHHVGVLVDYREGLGIIHALKSYDAVKEHRLDAKMRGNISDVFCFRSLD